MSISVGLLSVAICPAELSTVCVERQTDNVVVGPSVPNVSPVGAESMRSKPQVCESWEETPIKTLAEASAVRFSTSVEQVNVNASDVDVDQLDNPSRVETQVSVDRSEGSQVSDVVKKTSSSGSLSSVVGWGDSLWLNGAETSCHLF